jgi:hypothetical protein
MRRVLRDNSLSIACLAAFAVSLAGQALAGQRAFNEEQLAHGGDTVSLAHYLVTSEFGAAVLENWQSEFLQFTFFILVTVWLVQRGSNESKRVDEVGSESDQRQRIGEYSETRSPRWAKTGGWRTTVYSNSLVIAMTAVFFAAWGTQSVTGGTSSTARSASMTSRRSRGLVTWCARTSGRRPSRTGSPSSWPWARWPS